LAELCTFPSNRRTSRRKFFKGNLRDLVIYLLATAAAGGAYSLLFVGGLQVISAAAPERNRGGILSALYLLGYLSMGALALALGATRRRGGLVSPSILVRPRSS
jgi:hypothetical protein